MIKLNLFRRRHHEIPAAPETEPEAESVAEEETTDNSPGRNYGKLITVAVLATAIAVGGYLAHNHRSHHSNKPAGKKTEEKAKKPKQPSHLEKLVCKDENGDVVQVILYNPKKPGNYWCSDKSKFKNPRESDLENKANENSSSPVSIDNSVSSATASSYIEPSRVGNPYTRENKIVQEIDGVPQAKELAPHTYKGVMSEGSLQLSPDLKHVAWRTWFSPTNSRGNVYAADVSFDENGEIHVYQESIRAVKTYQGLTGPRVTDISWADNGALEVVTDNIVRLGRYGLRTNHVEKTEIVSVK